MSDAVDLDEAVEELLVESHESLGELDHGLVVLESDRANRSVVAGIFRTIHSTAPAATGCAEGATRDDGRPETGEGASP